MTLLLCTTLAHAGQRLVISTQPFPPFSTADETGFYDVLFPEIGHRAGVEITVVRQPYKRSLELTNEGINDGDGPRVRGYEERYPALVMVDETIFTARFVAFTRTGTRITSWDDLAGKLAAYPRGWSLPAQGLPETLRLARVASTHNAIAMLVEGRVDAALTVLELGQHDIEKHGYDNVVNAPTLLTTQQLYLYLHKRHVGLVPVFKKALLDIKKDGTWNKLFHETVSAQCH